MTSRVLVTDCEQSSSLAATRSLGRAGYEVLVCGHDLGGFAARSRYSHGSFQVPDPLEEPPRFAEAVRALCERERIDVLLPMTDQSLMPILRIRDRISSRLPWPSAAAVERAADKSEAQRVARGLGVAIPEQRIVESRMSLAHLDLATVRFPVVLKPSRSLSGRIRNSVSHAGDANRLARQLAAYPDHAFPILLQQRIVGPGTGIFLLRWEGRTVAHFAHRRLRESPPSGGSSVFCESILSDPRLLEASEGILESMGWTGVAMIEYKVDASTGTPYLMEINGRFWGSLQLAVDAGVDFPRLLVELALGRTPPPQAPYRVGVRLRSFWRDVDHLLARMRWDATALNLPPDAPPRGQAIRDFFHWRPADRVEIFRFSDPLPAVRETLDFLRRRS